MLCANMLHGSVALLALLVLLFLLFVLLMFGCPPCCYAWYLVVCCNYDKDIHSYLLLLNDS